MRASIFKSLYIQYIYIYKLDFLYIYNIKRVKQYNLYIYIQYSIDFQVPRSQSLLFIFSLVISI
jgi:hypothetical protein